jgi:hypothetical protein
MKSTPILVVIAAAFALTPNPASAESNLLAYGGLRVRREIREGVREIQRERREAYREIMRADSPREVRREIREGIREVERERRELRREVRRELRRQAFW